MKPVIWLAGALLAGVVPIRARAGVTVPSTASSSGFCYSISRLSCSHTDTRISYHKQITKDSFNLTPPRALFDTRIGATHDSYRYHPSFDSADSDSVNGEGKQTSAFENFSPGQSTAFGQHVVEWTLLASPVAAYALSPLIDHRLHYTDTGIWKRSRQLDFEYGVIAGEVAGGLWFGGKSRIGKTFWRAIDASFYTAVSVQAMKYIFSRARPRQSPSPHHWFQGACCQSFPSGEVSFQASAVTPFIAEFHKQHPWVWALEAFPAYDALARMKAHGHWQTDVLAAWAIGTAWGLYAQYEPKPLILSIMPHGIYVGIHASF